MPIAQADNSSVLLRNSSFKDWGMEENLHRIQSSAKAKCPFGIWQQEDFRLGKAVIAKWFFQVCISVLIVNIAKTDNIVNILTIWGKKKSNFFFFDGKDLFSWSRGYLGFGNFPLGGIYWKDKGSGKEYE